MAHDAVEAGKGLVDQAILGVYNNLFSKVVRQKLETAIEDGPPLPETVKKALEVEESEISVRDLSPLESEDEKNPNAPCQIKQGSVKDVIDGLNRKTIALAAEIRPGRAKEAFQVFEIPCAYFQNTCLILFFLLATNNNGPLSTN